MMMICRKWQDGGTKLWRRGSIHIIGWKGSLQEGDPHGLAPWAGGGGVVCYEVTSSGVVYEKGGALPFWSSGQIVNAFYFFHFFPS